VKLEDHRIYMVILAEHVYTSIRSEPWRDELDRRWIGLDEGRVTPTSFLRGFWWHRVWVVEDRSRVVLEVVEGQQMLSTRYCMWIQRIFTWLVW